MLWSLRPCQLYNFSQIFRCLFIFMLTSGQLDLTGLLRVKYTSSGECKNQGTKLNISKWNFTDLTLLYTLILGYQIKYIIYSNDRINWYEIMWRSPLLSIPSLNKRVLTNLTKGVPSCESFGLEREKNLV